MKQFSKILRFELSAYFKNKLFVGLTVFFALVIAVMMFFPKISAFFEAEEGEQETRPVMFVKTEEFAAADFVEEQFKIAFADYDVRLSDASVEELKAAITGGQAECAFVLTSPVEYTYYVNNLSLMDANAPVAEELLQRLSQMQTMLENGMDAEGVTQAMSVTVQGTTESLGKDQVQNFFYTYIMIFALYFVILLYGQMVITSVATEKTSRAMELLITSANPTAMMFGKILAACLAGFTQLLCIFGTALVCYQFNRADWESNEIVRSIFNIPPELFGYLLLFFLLGFLLYAFLFRAAGSVVSKLEETNTIAMPITLLFVVGFVVVMMSMASGDVDSTLMKTCSFVPFTAPMAMFTRLAMSTVATWEIVCCVLLLLGTTVGVGILSAKIYRVGVLLYGKPPKLTTLIKTIIKG